MQHPDRIGKYVVEEYLGGGMSHVYRAKDPVLGKTVAVKILTAETSSDEESRNRFLREARVAANIEHPNIISVYDFGEDQGRPYMVMEFLKGEDLRSVIKENRTGTLENKLRIALQIAKALECIHGHTPKIVHRDIKPDNVHIDRSGNVKLMDFGIAKTEDLTITRPGFALGTPYYMAPEQVRGKEATHLVDIYAYGILLFELFTGAKPITGENVEQIFFRILQEPLDLQPLHEGAVPESIIALIRSCTAKDPAQRPQNVSEICSTLVRQLDGSQVPAKPPAPDRVSPSRTKWVFAGVLAALAVSLLLGLVFYRTPVPEPKTGDTVADNRPATPAPAVLSDVIQTRAGEMVLVKAGEFLSGPNKTPQQLGAFYINRTEVTNEAYGQFCADMHEPLPPGFANARPDFPVVNITIVEARKFAQWAGGRLPLQKEWEKAARGTDGREYPWGNEANADLANVARDNRAGAIASTKALSSAATPWGVQQMVGNVWEFVDERKPPTAGAIENFKDLLTPAPNANEPWYLMMGGSYEEGLLTGATYDTASVPARFRSPRIGFRCVKDPE